MSLLLALQGGAPPAITGTGAITAPLATLAASGLEIFTGPAAGTAPVATLGAAGSQVFGGQVAVAAPLASLSASGLKTFAGAAVIGAPVAVLAASGAIGAPTSAGGWVPGIASRPRARVRGRGAVRAPVATVRGVGVVIELPDVLDLLGIEETEESLLALV